MDFNPVLMSYAVVTVEPPTVALWIDPAKLSPAVMEHLGANDVESHPYEGAVEGIAQLIEANGCSKVLLDTVSCNLAIYERLSELSGCEPVEERSCLLLPKALKNAVEVEGYYACHRRDGAALTAFLCWLENSIVERKESGHTEYSVGQRLRECRSANDQFVDLSFESIVGFKANGADGTIRCVRI